jgi:Mce-associated membrane protein
MTRNRPIAGHRARANLTAVRSPDRAATIVLDRPLLVDRPINGKPEPTAPNDESGADRLGTRSTTWMTRSRALLAGLLAIALTALATFGLLAYRVRADEQVETARDQAVAAAHDNAATILSYDYRHLDADFAAARRTLTGAFASDYKVTTSKMVRPGAEQYHVVVKAEIAAESVVSATADQVVVLLFVNQTTTSTRLDGPRVDLNRVRMTMAKVDGRWLVSKVVAL